MKVSVIGTGYVGLVTGTCLAEIGHHVHCIDINPEKVNMLNEGQSPIYEIGLQDILSRNIEQKKLFFTTEYSPIEESEVIFIAVGTPSKKDGSANLDYIFQAVDQLSSVVQAEALVVLKSTVPVGTGAAVKKRLLENNVKNVQVINNPEFLREGTAVEDFMRPDRIVIGSENEAAAETMKELYAPLVRQGNPIYFMSNISAEMTKYAANCFLATKISFINEIAQLCDASGADIEEVRKGIMSDHRIGRYFLYPGPGYGGSCFPKDVKALLNTAQQYDVSMKVIDATEEVNREQKTYMFRKMKKAFPSLKDKIFTFWGVAFKAGTDDVRESPAIEMAQALISEGAKIAYYDPEGSENFLKIMKELSLDAHIKQYDDKYAALKDSHGLVTMTEWREFRIPDFKRIQADLEGDSIFDARNLYEGDKLKAMGFNYYSIGKDGATR